jgi:hypothetical protein
MEYNQTDNDNLVAKVGIDPISKYESSLHITGMATISSEKPIPNWWWRMWYWLLLGWWWEKV